ncbi:hypothetical protein AB0L65_22660 [Nonomuraea sp. NPDC052116]|uniref:hypothetical protein n=1 Tax=Nonomuraea sp. NPDC052116 TaxID=3155665 RepID=UPI0034261915
MPLSTWWAECLRLTRTGRLIVLVGTFVFFGITGPAVTRYMGEILATAADSRMRIIMTPPTPADGIISYTSNATQLGMIAAVIVTALACAIDAKPALAVYYRSRARFADLLLPRVTVIAAGVIAAYLCGMLAAWAETVSLIGAPSLPGLLQAAALQSLYLVFAVCVTALAATLVRGVLGTVGTTLIVLLLAPILRNFPAIADWTPPTLVAPPAALIVQNGAADHPRAVAVTLALCCVTLVLALLRGSRAVAR